MAAGDGVAGDALERQLFGRAGVAQGQRRRIEPECPPWRARLKRPGVTMTILWEEYREVRPEGYGYSRFCDLLHGFEPRLTPVMRQHHVAGEKAFVDYSGKRIGIADPTTGEIREAEISVGVLGASPKLLVPDNLRSGVNKASFYDPQINRTSARWRRITRSLGTQSSSNRSNKALRSSVYERLIESQA